MVDIEIRRKFLLLSFILLASLFLIAGCVQPEKAGMEQNQDQEKEASEPSAPPEAENKTIKTIRINEGEFQGANGWLDNDQIVYTVIDGATSRVYAYSLFSGEQELLYESSHPIASVTVSPAGKYILIRSSPGTYEAALTVIKTSGKVVWEENISGFDFAVEWNPYDEESILIASFTEDWEFTPYHIDIAKGTYAEFNLREPFAKWGDSNHLFFLDWDNESPSLFAPLVKQSIDGHNETVVQEDIFQFDAAKDRLMTITVPANQSDQAMYTFMDNHFKKLSSFSIPHLTRFSDWLVPYYDWTPRGIITFQPLYSAESDMYAGGFQLISVDSETGEKEVLFEDMENAPISCSTDGKACLTGFYLEELIMTDRKEVIRLVDYNE
ncbi:MULTISPECIES: YqgU-like beta propeller domain-containing protein [Cytobacillus]|uniref:YqgU-like beta propeller domain-containing protein n=1 Tax=Cytobacillus TaxID=2675230 RepID=UPI0020403756|nr:hypothetical protein [Cytobacillus firmus]MCM3704534.1 hypothetical protein [Cytobacillus firmus]